jgi:hypothetical protein
METERPKFLPSYLGLLAREARESGWASLVPFGLIACLSIGAVTAYFTPSALWDSANWQVSTALFAGFLTINGLMLALGWTAFGRIYDILFRKDFVAFLVRHDHLNPYLVHINYMHFVQIASVLVSGFGLVFVLFSVSILAERIVLAAVVGVTAYAITQAIAAVNAMNDLVWQAASFEQMLAAKDGGDGKVTSIADRR